MDFNEIVQVFGNGFFPMLACGLLFKLFYDMSKTLEGLNTSLQIMNERLTDIENKLKDN